MSLEAMVWALNCDSAPDPLSKLVLIGLANHADSTGCAAYPSRESLAQYASCSVRSVQRKLAELEAGGLIERGDQRLVEHLRGDRRPVVYNIVTGGLFVTPLRGDRGVTSSRSRGDRTGTHGVTLLAHKPSIEQNPPTPQAPTCSRHAEPVERCRACRAAQAAEDRAAETARRMAQRIERQRFIRAAIDGCPMCDDAGELADGTRCDHDQDAPARARRGADAVRRAAGWGATPNSGGPGIKRPMRGRV